MDGWKAMQTSIEYKVHVKRQFWKPSQAVHFNNAGELVDPFEMVVSIPSLNKNDWEVLDCPHQIEVEEEFCDICLKRIKEPKELDLKELNITLHKLRLEVDELKSMIDPRGT